jgi:hypothetical protein
LSISDKDETVYTNATTAVADAVNILTYVTVTVSDLGGGVGVLRIHGTSSNCLLSAIALREV